MSITRHSNPHGMTLNLDHSECVHTDAEGKGGCPCISPLGPSLGNVSSRSVWKRQKLHTENRVDLLRGIGWKGQDLEAALKKGGDWLGAVGSGINNIKECNRSDGLRRQVWAWFLCSTCHRTYALTCKLAGGTSLTSNTVTLKTMCSPWTSSSLPDKFKKSFTHRGLENRLRINKNFKFRSGQIGSLSTGGGEVH